MVLRNFVNSFSASKWKGDKLARGDFPFNIISERKQQKYQMKHFSANGEMNKN